MHLSGKAKQKSKVFSTTQVASMNLTTENESIEIAFTNHIRKGYHNLILNILCIVRTKEDEKTKWK